MTTKAYSRAPSVPKHLAQRIAAIQALDPIGAFLALADEIQGFAFQVCRAPITAGDFGKGQTGLLRRLQLAHRAALGEQRGSFAFADLRGDCNALKTACESFLVTAVSWRQSPTRRHNDYRTARRFDKVTALEAGQYARVGQSKDDARRFAEYGPIFLEWRRAYEALAELRASVAVGKGPDDKVNRRKKPRQSPRPTRPLTAKEMEAAQLVSEYKGNLAAAGKVAGISRQAMEKRYKKAMGKLGKTVLPKPKTKGLPVDRRGQISLPEMAK